MNKYQTCHGCPDREVGCHATCEGYQARYKANRQENKARLYGYVEPAWTKHNERVQQARTQRKARRNP